LRIINFITLLLIYTITPAHAAKIAIVIDDIGNQASDQELLNLNAHLTYAVLPHTPYSFIFSQQAAKQQRDVIIHLPMQADSNNNNLGPGALTLGMSKRQHQRTLIAAMESIPHAIGINNHMGSLLTRSELPMQWTMELLRQHNMFFLDSKTTIYSKVESIADQYGVNALHRNIFLDNVRQPSVMDSQFQRLINIAKQYGSAIAIGHPYPETYQLLNKHLPLLSKMGIELVPLSKLLPTNLAIEDDVLGDAIEKHQFNTSSVTTVDATEP